MSLPSEDWDMTTPYVELLDDSEAPPKRIDLRDGGSISIGRHADNTIPIQDDRASRFHCVIERTGAAASLRDLKSRNGTKVNEQPVDSAVLRNGDVVRIGKTRFRFCDPTAVPLEVAPAHRDRDELRRAPDFGQQGRAAARAPGAWGGGEPDYNAMLADMANVSDLAVEGDWEQILTGMADAAADKSITESDIAMVNASGVTLHAAESSGAQRKGRADSDVSREGVRALRLLILTAIRTRATDIHIEPKADYSLVRLRVDGTMVDAVRLRKDLAAKLVGVVKVLANIDIAQKSVIQEGHFGSQASGRRIDYRVSFTPSMHGQKLVVRVLDLNNAPRFIHELNLPAWMQETIRKVSRQDAGMVLVCGPTGSGKTTTLYAVLRDIDVRQRNVITIEDPVEYQIDGVTQIPIDEVRGNTFGNLLRSCLRQDPDVILLGEIRDQETAATAMQAAMTGHLVLSTVHARDTIGTIFRLLDLGVEPYLVASSLNLVLAQRLIRQLCPHCKDERKPTPKQAMQMGKFVEGVSRVYSPVGCPRCLNTGYFGRRALFELLGVTDELRDVILKTPTIQAIREALRMTMFVSLQQHGYQLALEGLTSVDEVERVTGTE